MTDLTRRADELRRQLELATVSERRTALALLLQNICPHCGIYTTAAEHCDCATPIAPEPMASTDADGRDVCPSCGSQELSGEMGSFWVFLDDDGSPQLNFHNITSETDLTDRRLCRQCGTVCRL